MTPDAPRPDLDEAERRLRHWVKTTDVLPWYFANELERHFVEYDRRGTALAERQSKYPHEPDMSWDEIEDRLRTADQAAVYQVFAYNERLGDLVARNGEELSQLRSALAERDAENARLRAAVHAVLRAWDTDCPEGVHHSLFGAMDVLRALAAAPAPRALLAPASGGDTGAASPQHEDEEA